MSDDRTADKNTTDRLGDVLDQHLDLTQEAEAAVDLKSSVDTILKEIVLPVTEVDLEKVTLTISDNPPNLVLKHVAETPYGKQQIFEYQINIGTETLEIGAIPHPDEPRVLGFPSPPYNAREIVQLRDAFRSTCIDDPVLYPRFTRQTFKLEDYQEQAVAVALQDLGETKRSLLVLGTGAGKTEIAFEIAAKRLQEASNLEETAVLFVVNNNIILSEAGEKFNRRFAELYSKSHAHGGDKNISGNLVFATPGSILSDSLLEDFLADKKRVLIMGLRRN
jgi:hypothetical protein